MLRRTLTAVAPLLLLTVPLAAQDDAPLGSVAALAPVAARRAAGVPVTAPADTDSTSGGAARDGARSDSTGRPHTAYSPGERFAMRSVVGALGWVGGAYLGARVNEHVRRSDCHCEYPGLEAATLGGIVGTTLVVSAMGYGDRCNGATRATLTALGAAAGTAVGIFAVYGTGSLLVIPLGGGVGGASGAALCTAEGPKHHRR